MKYLMFLVVFFTMSSCIEIIDDLTFKSDGSGTFKYTLNLSASKLKVNSILALDSLDGKKVPSIQEIKDKIKLSESVSDLELEILYLIEECERLNNALSEISKILKRNSHILNLLF